MRFRLRSLFLIVLVVAVSIFAATRFYRRFFYPKLEVTCNGYPTVFEEPYLSCTVLRDPDDGRMRAVFLQLVTSQEGWERMRARGGAPEWLDSYQSRYFVDGALVQIPQHAVVVYFATGEDSPESAVLDLVNVPRKESWWPDSDALWKQLKQRD